MDIENQKNGKNSKNYKSWLLNKSNDSSRRTTFVNRQRSPNQSSANSILPGNQDYLQNPVNNIIDYASVQGIYSEQEMLMQKNTPNNSFGSYKTPFTNKVSISNSQTLNWSPYNFMGIGTYPMLPSQMPPLPALPQINGASSPTAGGNSSSSTYANTTASEENHQHPLYASNPQTNFQNNDALQFMQGGPFLSNISQLSNNYSSNGNNSFIRNPEHGSVISCTDTLVPFSGGLFMNQMSFAMKKEWTPSGENLIGMVHPNLAYHPSLSAPSSEITGTTTIMGDDYMAPLGPNGWNNNYNPNKFSKKITSTVKSRPTGFGAMNLTQSQQPYEATYVRFDCARTTATAVAICLSLVAFFSPAAMVVLPISKVIEWPNIKCNVDCESQLISLTIKLILIGAAAYLTFLRNHLCLFCHRKSSYDALSGLTLSRGNVSQTLGLDGNNEQRYSNPDTNSALPRLTFLRSFLLFLTFIITVVFWLFYGIRMLDNDLQRQYSSSVLLASQMTDCLLLVHYLGLVIIFLREMNHETLSIKVIRCPDGETKIYKLKKMSVQLAAISVLRNYIVDFKVYNPFIEAPPRRRASSRGGQSSRMSSQGGGVASLPPGAGIGPYQPPPGALGGLAKYKFYDVDGPAPISNIIPLSKRSLGSPTLLIKCPSHNRRKASSLKSVGTRSQRSCPTMKSPGGRVNAHHSRKATGLINTNNDRYYEELEFEKRVAKRRVRLMLASEDAFRNLFKVEENSHPVSGKLLDAYEAAQAMFSTLLKPLQKFLRTTRQQPRFSMEWVIGHLQNCLNYDLGFRAFLEPFLSQGPVLEDPGYQQQLYLDDDVVISWTIYSDRLVSSNISDGTVFHLCQGDISLFCTVRSLPNFHLTEEIFPEKKKKFIFKLDSETSV